MSSFLTDLHAGFGTPHGAVVDLAEQTTGRRVVRVERVIRGYDNEVHRIELADETTVFARIRRPGEAGSDHSSEVTAMQWAREVGVPVPEVLALERVEAPDGERDAMVVAQARGSQLPDLLPSLSADQRQTAMTSVGHTLALLHTVRTPGVWRAEADGSWPNAADVRRGFIAERTAERPQLEAAGLNVTEIERTLAILGTSPDTPASGNDPVLCHGDVIPEHVFVGPELEVSDLIDWGMWHGGSSIGELAYVAMTQTPRDLADIVAGHGCGNLDDPDVRQAIDRSVVNLVIGYIAHHVTVGDTDSAARNVAALRDALSRL